MPRNASGKAVAVAEKQQSNWLTPQKILVRFAVDFSYSNFNMSILFIRFCST